MPIFHLTVYSKYKKLRIIFIWNCSVIGEIHPFFSFLGKRINSEFVNACDVSHHIGKKF